MDQYLIGAMNNKIELNCETNHKSILPTTCETLMIVKRDSDMTHETQSTRSPQLNNHLVRITWIKINKNQYPLKQDSQVLQRTQRFTSQYMTQKPIDKY